MKQRSSESGFVLLALLFFIAVLAVILALVIPSYVMQSRRDTEDELIFRGAEHARAIRKYQNKCGLLPVTIDQMLQGCGNGIPTLRKRYLDPTSGEEFRLIYVNSDGTLQNSRYATLRDARTNSAQTMSEVAEALADDVGAGAGTGGVGGTVTQQTGLVGVASRNDHVAVKRFLSQDRYVNWEFVANVNRTVRGGASQNNASNASNPNNGTGLASRGTNRGGN